MISFSGFLGFTFVFSFGREKLIWIDNYDKAFEKIMKARTKTPILAFSDFIKEFILDMDASFNAIGAVLKERKCRRTRERERQ